MLGECDGERLTLKFVLNYGSRTLVKIFTLVIFMENWQLIRSGTPRFYSHFNYDRLGFLQVCDNEGGFVWRRL